MEERARRRIAVVTGAGRGLGRGVAVALARRGHPVVGVARSAAQLTETADIIRTGGGQMLARLGAAVFEGRPAHDVLYHEQSLALQMDGDGAELRLRMPFAEKGDVELKKIGLELVIRVGGRKRIIMLPSSLASFRPRDARLVSGHLRVRFERQESAAHGQVNGRQTQPSAREAV